MSEEKKEQTIQPAFVYHFWNGWTFRAVIVISFFVFIFVTLWIKPGDSENKNKETLSDQIEEITSPTSQESNDTSFKEVWGVENGGEIKYKFIALVDTWSDPIIIPGNKNFIFDCSGCETGKRIEIMLNGKVITVDDTSWYTLSNNLPPLSSFRFKANGTETKVWGSIVSK